MRRELKMLSMRGALLALLALGLLLLVAVPQSPAQYGYGYGAESVPGELVVGLEPGAPSGAAQAVSATVQGFGGRIVDEIPEISAIKVMVPEGSEQAVMGMVQSLRDVDYVEPNYIAEMLAEPDDEHWDKQWDMRKIEAPRAWDLVKGSKDIVVAVVDSGIDYTHPDLKGGYTPGGYDYVHDDNDPYPVGDGIGEDRGVAHGSHVAGIVGATIDNGKGIAGLAQVSILGFRVLDDEGRGSYWNVAKGIVEAAKAGAKIINLSLGGPKSGKVMESAVNFAQAAGTLVIAAAGNTGRRGVLYPARYEAVIAVSSTDKHDNLSPFSSYGPEVELAAPGGGERTPPEGNIYSTVPGNGYAYMRGTSMAAPHVAGVAALVWSVNPELTAEQVRKILCDTADDLGPPGRDEKFGCGRVNAYKAVRAAQEGAVVPPPPSRPRPTMEELTVEVDRGCGPSGTSYEVGEMITISYTVPEDATVKIYRVGYAEAPELLTTRSATAGVTQTAALVRAERAGVETVVIQARTEAGEVLTAACTYSIGGVSVNKSRIWIDKGCGASYRIGEPITVSAQVDESGTIGIIDFATDGSITTILERRASAGETVTLHGRVVGPTGRDTLVVRAKTDSGMVVTNACSLEIIE